MNHNMTEKTMSETAEGMISDIVKDNGKYGVQQMRTYRMKALVSDAEAEMTEYTEFSRLIADYRQQGILVVDNDDPSTEPAFVIRYPKSNTNGQYMVVKCYTILLAG